MHSINSILNLQSESLVVEIKLNSCAIAEPMCQHDSPPLQCTPRRVRGRRRCGHGRVVGGHHVGRLGLQTKMAEQEEGRGEAL